MFAKRLIQACLIVILVLSSLAATGKAQAWSGCGSTYVVQRGDWLSKIASTCGVTVAQLYAANPWIRNYRYIYPGWVLTIPGGYDGGWNQGGSCGPATDAYGNYWVVCRGDTLGRIARYYGVSWRYLQSVNGIWDPNRIFPGQVIRI